MKFLLFVFSLLMFLSLNAQDIPDISKNRVSTSDNYLYVDSKKKFFQERDVKKELIVYKYLCTLFVLLSFILFISLLYYRRKKEFYKQRVYTLPYKKSIERKHQDIITKKEEVISYVSHELRTPMTAIRGLTHLLLESKISNIQKEYLQKLDETSEYMLLLLNDILDLSKIEAGKLQLETTEFNLNDIVNYIYNVVSVQAKNNNLNILVSVAKDVPSHIMGDPLRLGQVLINLMSNAIKFTKEGEISLEVRKRDSNKDAISLEFIVSDTGIGMTKEQLQKLFSSFYQAEESTSRKYGGSGLGLNISKQLISLMGGDIGVESKKGFGTTFSFVLPFHLKDYTEKRHYRLPSHEYLNKNILLIDSCNKNAIPLIQALRYFNYSVHNVLTVEDLTPEREKEAYDIVIVNLQNLNEKTKERLKQMQQKQKFKLVILSPLYSSLSSQLSETLHIDAYLKPPITTQNILNLIIELYHTQNVAKTRKDLLIGLLKKYAGKKVLVVEDNELNYKVIAGMLAKTDIETSYAENGEKALSLLEENVNFDLILMDINMPGLNGYETTLKIRQNSALDTLPIVALSADNSPQAMQKATQSGMQGYLLKPIKLNDFYSKIIELLKKQNS